MTLTRQQVLEQFSNDDLVSHSYLDQSLPKCEEKNIQQLQSSASQLLSQLDYHSQDLTWTLDGLLTKLTQSQNKIRYQIELLTGDLDTLRGRVESMSVEEKEEHADIDKNETPDQVDSVPAATETDITAQLQKYDSARRKMEAVIITLRKAKEFDQSNLDTQTDQLITSGEFEQALNLVDEALQLAQVWKGTGGYNNRVKAIMATKKKIEREITKRDSVDVPRDRVERTDRESSVASSTKDSSPMPEGFSLFGELSRRMGYN
ncbi:hypothetical protein CJU90_4054 [Yarrowia sp. C11]|nr:hypothetical protein CKK34_5664 [Yarrowia sp. E02]KAG5367748.1 hypothetical protein CJU90_4054 [Yarrowia sp. C11]